MDSEEQLDVLTLLVRLEQIDEESRPGHFLWTDRVMGCDVPRLRRYIDDPGLLEAEARARLTGGEDGQA